MEAQQKADARTAAIEAAAKKFEDEIVTLLEKQKLLETAFNRPVNVMTGDEKAKDIRQKANKLFNEFARVNASDERTDLAKFAREYIKSHEGDLEIKALTVNSDPNGGFLTLPEFGGIIETYVYETSPLRRLASVISIGTDTLEYVTDNDQAGWGWVGETQARPDTYTPQVGKLAITVGEMYAMPNVSQKMLDDAYIDVEAWIAGKVAEVFGRGEATAFLSGNGINKPRGLLTYPAGTSVGQSQVQQVYSGNASGFTYLGLIALMNSLKEPYQNNAVFLTQRGSMAALLGLVDGQQRPIFNMMYDKNAGLENSILGKPVVFAADMPSVATNAVAMAYGDFKKAYQIVDRKGISVLRDPFTNKPFVRFYTTKRVGGAVVNYEAYALLQIHT
jgi:HK97 family phage major capsid protein